MNPSNSIKTLEEAREFFKNDRFATENGMEILSVEKGRSVIHLNLTESHKNAAGGVMGGVMFTMADFSCAVAANFNSDSLFVSVDSGIKFLSACRGKELFAKASCIKSGRSVAFFESEIKDELDNLVAKATFTMYGIKK